MATELEQTMQAKKPECILQILDKRLIPLISHNSNDDPSQDWLARSASDSVIVTALLQAKQAGLWLSLESGGGLRVISCSIPSLMQSNNVYAPQ
eukprot:372521-Amphidinium_carterae.1